MQVLFDNVMAYWKVAVQEEGRNKPAMPIGRPILDRECCVVMDGMNDEVDNEVDSEVKSRAVPEVGVLCTSNLLFLRSLARARLLLFCIPLLLYPA